MSGAIGIVYPHSNIDTVPCLVGAVDALARAGFSVDLLVKTSAEAAPAFAHPRVRIVSIGPEASDEPPAALRGRLRFLPPRARASLARCYSRMRPRSHQVKIDTTYDYWIGVDADGLVLANEMARGAPVVYFSLELLLSEDLRTTPERQLKARERTLSREAAFIVIQDAQRGSLLARDNQIPIERMTFVPNSPPGPARRSPNRYWHDRFGLPPYARVVLHAGSLGAWTGIEELIASVPTWPEPWMLVVHTRYDAQSSPYVERLQKSAQAGRVHFSLQPVARQEYDALIDGADVGVAFYVPSAESAFTQRNIQTIGLSSGKLAYFLRAGLPVIVNSATSVAAQIRAAACGIAVEDAADVPEALDRIGAEYDCYSRNSCSFFDRELDSERAFEDVIARLRELRVAA
ncbi:MAG: hypothetical protein JOZ81_17055 [Chloroflexi bacterium]|nr:hypothetical protein [Chloroflexota bacterium]